MCRFIVREDGFSMIEILVSLTVMLITIFGVMGLVVMGTKANAEAKNLAIATKAMEGAMERITTLDLDSITATFPDGYEEGINLLDIGNGQARWAVTYPNTYSPDLLNIKVTVYWQGSDGREHSIELSALKG